MDGSSDERRDPSRQPPMADNTSATTTPTSQHLSAKNKNILDTDYSSSSVENGDQNDGSIYTPGLDTNVIDDPRQAAGTVMSKLSDVINDNLSLARVGAISTITLLAAYGISQTPLFFRYYTVADIPQKYFVNRGTLYGRLVQVEQEQLLVNDTSSIPVQLYIRHLSLAERFLSQNAYHRLMQYHPAQLSGGPRVDENKRQLLKFQLAGVRSIDSRQDINSVWLEKLASDRTLVKLQLLARQMPVKTNATKLDKRPLADFDQSALHNNTFDNTTSTSTTMSEMSPQIAIGKLYYFEQEILFKTRIDIGASLIEKGRALVNDTFLTLSDSSQTKIIDTTSSLRELQKDVKYMELLSKLECQAAAKRYGVWFKNSFRRKYQDVVDEADFQTKAPWYKKAWRWLRGE